MIIIKLQASGDGTRRGAVMSYRSVHLFHISRHGSMDALFQIRNWEQRPNLHYDNLHILMTNHRLLSHDINILFKASCKKRCPDYGDGTVVSDRTIHY